MCIDLLKKNKKKTTHTQQEFLDPPRSPLIYAEPEIPITPAQGNLRGRTKYHRKSKTAIKNQKLKVISLKHDMMTML